MLQAKYDCKTIFLSIEGLDYAREAEQLIRLFYDGNIKTYINIDPHENHSNESSNNDSSEKHGTVCSDNDFNEKNSTACSDNVFFEKDSSAIHIEMTAEEVDGQFIFTTIFFKNSEQIVHEKHSFVISNVASPTDIFLQSKKLCAGNTLFRALEKFFQKSLPWGSLSGVRPTKLASCCLDVKMSDIKTIDLLTTRTGMNERNAQRLVTIAHKELPYRTPPANSVALYIGIPFCASRCSYCSFTSYSAVQFGHLIPSYMKALIKEIQFIGEWLTKKGLTLSTIYIGGGTPTALPAIHLQQLVINMADFLPVTSALEYTIEAGRPDTIDEEKLFIIKNSGATRISINPQTKHQLTLDRIGRNHSAEQVEKAFSLAKSVGITNINADIIAGLPGENLDMFEETLRWILSYEPKSLTVHTLAIKRASRLHENVHTNDDFQASDISVEAMVDKASEYAFKSGYEPYYLYRQKNIRANLENVGYAKPGFECRYNIETMSERQTIIAIGSGGITKMSQLGDNLERVFNVRDLDHYIVRIDEMIERKVELLNKYYK